MAFVCVVVYGVYQHFRTDDEASRIAAVQTILEEKLAAYHMANGGYPESLHILTFTSSPQEVRLLSDIRKMNYQPTQDGYVLSYEGASGYSNVRSFTSWKDSKK